MRDKARTVAGIVLAMAAAGLSGHGLAQPAPAPHMETSCAPCCYHPQSPRSLTAADWNWTSATPAVARSSEDSVVYTPRPGVRLTLHRCSQHYHCEIENAQVCPGQRAAPAAGGGECPRTPPLDSWVEIHTVYHNGPVVTPTPEGLGSCTSEPLVVVGYSAKVTGEPVRPPLPVHFGPPGAEWSGSATNVDKPPPPAPPECKAAAFWSFALGCDFKVSQLQLQPFIHPDRARAPQARDRLSRDLTHVVRQ